MAKINKVNDISLHKYVLINGIDKANDFLIIAEPRLKNIFLTKFKEKLNFLWEDKNVPSEKC